MSSEEVNYDNSLSFLHKRAAELGTPLRFVVVRPTEDAAFLYPDLFSLDDNRGAEFYTVFDLIRAIMNENPEMTLLEIWGVVSAFRGDRFDPVELIFIWYASLLPDAPPGLFDQIKDLLINIGRPDQYGSMEEFIDSYERDWLVEYEAELRRDRERLAELIELQKQIASIEPVIRSPITLDSSTISYDFPVDEGVDPLIDIFNSAITSYLVPYIQYSVKQAKGGRGERLYRIFKGRSLSSAPDYNNVILKPDFPSKGATIYLNIWKGVQEVDSLAGKKDDFETASLTYISDQNILRMVFTSPIGEGIDPSFMMNRIHAHLPLLPLPGAEVTPEALVFPPGPAKELRVAGTFTIYNVDLIETVLLHLIMVDPLFSSYLYLDESSRSFADRSRFTIHYRSMAVDLTKSKRTMQLASDRQVRRSRSDLSATITFRELPRGERFTVQSPDGTVNQHEHSSRLQSVNVKITRAASRRVVEQFMNVMTRLYRTYTIEGQNILQLYRDFIPDYGAAQGARAISRKGKIAELKAASDEIFAPNYARRCQPVSRQPIIIPPEEVESWTSEVITLPDGTKSNKMVLPFPKDSPTIIIGCSDDNPFPAVIANTGLKNKEEYPFLPCCFNTDQRVSRNSPLNRYLSDRVKVVTTAAKAAHIYKTSKIAESGRRGLLNTVLSSFLPTYRPGSNEEFLRLGVERSFNSFIHCIALATNNTDYMASRNKEQWAIEFRRGLFGQTKERTVGNITYEEVLLPELLRQEMFDSTNQNIVALATDSSTFFDPLLFYRALEYIFDVNIYVFPLSDQDRSGRGISSMDLPRHRHFHSLTKSPNRPAVLVLRHWGGEANALDYPQCELIVSKRGDELTLLFGEEMNRLLMPSLEFVARTITWQIYESAFGPAMTARLNLYSVVDYASVLGDLYISGQVIDSAGKARLLVVHPQFNNDDATELSPLTIYMSVLPTAPFNVPEYDITNAVGNLPDYERPVELFGEPVAITLSIDERFVTGLWFSIGDIQFGIYTPVKEVDREEFEQRFPGLDSDPELLALTVNIPREGQTTSVRRVSALMRAARIINQLMKYLYVLDGGREDPEEFLSRIVVMLPEEDRGDSAVIYDTKNFPRVLPREQVMQRLAQIAPTMFYQDRLIIYNEQMYFGLLHQLRRFASEIQGIEVLPGSYRTLQELFLNKEDFTIDHDSEFLLASIEEFDAWMTTFVPSSSLQQRTIQNLKETIQTQLNPNAFPYQEPYIYQQSATNSVRSSYDPREDKFYLVQNVAAGDLRRAVQVAYTWFVERINTGFRTKQFAGEVTTEVEPIQPETIEFSGISVSPPEIASPSIRAEPRVEIMLPAHKIYRISPGGSTILETDNSFEQKEFLEILDYGNETYAALLPIL